MKRICEIVEDALWVVLGAVGLAFVAALAVVGSAMLLGFWAAVVACTFDACMRVW